MEWSKIRISLSRRLLTFIVAVTALQQISEINSQGSASCPLEGCYPEGTICDQFDGNFSSEGTRFTTSRLNYCPDQPDKVSLWCIKREDKGCITSQCMPKSGSKRNEECRVVNMRDEYAEKKHTLNAYQEDCSPTEEKIVCCQPGSNETVLLAGYGAEAHEFPHQALLLISVRNNDGLFGNNVSSCGGTIYNEKFILTAAHCVVYSYKDPEDKNLEYSAPYEAKQIEVVVGTNIGMTARASNRYRVERVIVHEQYSSLRKNLHENIKNGVDPFVTQYDVALLQIEGTIKFDEYTKALKMAPPNFRPEEYADRVVIVGWGTTDNNDTTEYLQKSDVRIRDKDNDWGCNGYPDFLPDQHLCIGGIIDGVEYGKTAGKGDSGGPAICRDKYGFGVHCGITSFGGLSDDDCIKNPNVNTCSPSVYADVSYFRSWIIQEAGWQNTGNTTFFQAPLYGQNAGDELAQVKIISGDGNTCGGTLVSRDTVVTASHCLFDEKDEAKDLIVQFGSDEYYVQSVKIPIPPGKVERSVVNQKFYDGWRKHSKFLPRKVEEPYYDSNIGVIKLLKKVWGARPMSLSASKLIESDATVYEAAWMRNSTFGLRKFPSSLISRENCQWRYDRFSRKYPSFPIGELDVCMVEKYSGGNFCDREIGGGVFCDGPNGTTLCGVQVFRMCDFSTPKIIADIYYYAKTIKKMAK